MNPIGVVAGGPLVPRGAVLIAEIPEAKRVDRVLNHS